MNIDAKIPRHRRLQPLYRKLHALALVGMNYGGTYDEASDRIAVKRTGSAPVVFDGGAHRGEYTQGVLELRPHAIVHAFEPTDDCYAQLRARFPTGVHLHNFGLSDHDGQAMIFADKPQSSSASILPQQRQHWQGHTGFHPIGEVQLRTIDGVCEEFGIERIDLLKLDIEGAELAALRGARRMLQERRIELIQFEYGLPARSARVYLRDFFDLLEGWEIHRIVHDGTVPIDYQERWEIMWTTNYLAVPRAHAPDGPPIST
jgi:FkbM family methyltransferase